MGSTTISKIPTMTGKKYMSLSRKGKIYTVYGKALLTNFREENYL